MKNDSETQDPQPVAELEALIFSARGPATVPQIRRALPSLSPSRIGELVEEINESLRREGRPYEIAQVAAGYQFRTRPEFADVIRGGQPDRTIRLSRAALETLAVVAYRQPVTRAEIEQVRSVDCGAVLRSLLDRGLARIVGRRDAPGRPALYGTSHQFLETFGLNSLRDLPALGDLSDEELQPSARDEAETASEGEGSVVAESDPDVSTEAPGIDAEARAESNGSGTGPAGPH
jgi:segregation and condensation protein B